MYHNIMRIKVNDYHRRFRYFIMGILFTILMMIALVQAFNMIITGKNPMYFIGIEMITALGGFIALKASEHEFWHTISKPSDIRKYLAKHGDLL